MQHFKTAILYTVLSLLSLLAFTVGILFLPEEVAVHFNYEGVCDRMGSPWVYISLPAAAALVSGGLFAAALKENKNARILNICLVVVGAVFTVLGWALFALGAQGTQLGEKLNFPFAAAILLPLAILIMVRGATSGLASARRRRLQATMSGRKPTAFRACSCSRQGR